MKDLFKHLKENAGTQTLSFQKGELIPLTWSDLENEDSIKLLAIWREKASFWFPSQFEVTISSTKKWLKEQLLEKEDRALFFVSVDKKKVGHVGLNRYSAVERSLELDNIIRGEEGYSGIMTKACALLSHWAFEALWMEKLFLRVFSDNQKAITLYEKLGFQEIQRVPLKKVSQKGVSSWEEVVHSPYTPIERYFVTMRLLKGDFYETTEANLYRNTLF